MSYVWNQLCPTICVYFSTEMDVANIDLDPVRASTKPIQIGEKPLKAYLTEPIAMSIVNIWSWRGKDEMYGALHFNLW